MSNPLTSIADTQTTGTAPTVLPVTFHQTHVGAEHGQGASLTGASSGALNGQFGGRIGSKKPISIEMLYQAREAGSTSFNRALELLESACEALTEARDAADAGDHVALASELMRFENMLQPLFECRSIGEGFANVINTIHMAIANLQGEPLNDAQVTVLWRVMREVASAPFFNFPESLALVRQLKKVGLGLGNRFLTEWASESSTVEKE